MAHRGKQSMRKFKRAMKQGHPGQVLRRDDYRELVEMLGRDAGPGIRKKAKLNPPRVRGRKVKGGRAVTLRNFTGTIVRKADGRVEILGRGRKK